MGRLCRASLSSAGGSPSAPEDLPRHDLIGFRITRTGTVDPWRLPDGLTIGPAKPWSLVINAAWQAALAGLGLVWVPYWLASDALDVGTVREVLRAWRGKPTPFSLPGCKQSIRPKRAEIVKAFLDDHPARGG